MTSPSPTSTDLAGFRLHDLSRPLKLTLTGFVLLLAGGLTAAVGHHYFAYRNADGNPRFSYDDLRIALTGGYPPFANTPIETTLLWQQVHGDMRKHLPRQNDFDILEAWMRGGHTESTFNWPWTIAGGHATPAPPLNPPPGTPSPTTQGTLRRSPAEIINDHCVPCHNPGGERASSPLTGYAQVRQYLTHPTPPPTRPATTIAQLTSITHAHLLTMPIMALVLAVLFYFADWPPGSPAGRAIMTVLPIACLLIDAAAGWLAMAVAPAVVITIAARVAFLVTAVIQMAGTLGGLWQTPAAGESDAHRTAV